MKQYFTKGVNSGLFTVIRTKRCHKGIGKPRSQLGLWNELKASGEVSPLKKTDQSHL